MAETRIVYKRYDEEGRELDEKEIYTPAHSLFFKSSDLMNIIKKHNDLHAAHIKEINEIAQHNMTAFLTQANSGVDSDVASILFPTAKTKHSQELQRQTKKLYEALLPAIEWAVSQSDAEAKACLKTIGEYAVSKRWEWLLQEEESRELCHISMLHNMLPEDFLNIQKNKKQTAYVNQCIEEENKVRQSYSRKLVLGTDGDISTEARKLADKINEIHQKYGSVAIANQIKAIEETREKRVRNYGIFGRVFNFFNIRQKIKLSNLKTLRNSSAVKAVDSGLNKIATSAQSREKYNQATRLIEAKREFDSFKKENFLRSPAQFSLGGINKLREAIKLLLDSSEEKSRLKEFIERVKSKAITSIKSREFNAGTGSDLEILLAFFNGESIKGYIEFEQAKSEIIAEMEKRLAEFQIPSQAIHYINIIKQANPAILADEKLGKTILNRSEQYEAWQSIVNYRQKIFDESLSSEDMENLYLSAVPLLSETSTGAMQGAVACVVGPIKNEIRKFLIKENPDLPDKEQAKKYLALFQLEKINLPHNENLKLLVETRDEIRKMVIAKINAAESLIELDGRLANIHSIWPEAIYSEYIVIRNAGKEEFIITEGQRLDTLPPGMLEGEAKNFAVGIGGVTLKAGEERVFRCNPVMKDAVLKTAINDKAKSLMLDRTIDKVENGFSARISFLKAKEKSVIERVWSLVTRNNQTALTVENHQFYVHKLVNNYIDVLLEQRLNGFSDERLWINKQVAQDVEEVAEALNANLNNLLNEQEQKKCSKIFGLPWDPVDINHLLLQWQFINKFRHHFGSSAIEEIYKRAGMGIIYKMDEFGRNDPQFIHKFIGKMTKEQLEALNVTFVDTPGADEVEQIFSLDLTGEEQSAGTEGQTVLRKSMLLSGVSELVKQDLSRFLNGEPLDNELFQQHIEFVCANLPHLKRDADKLNASDSAKKLKEDIQNAMRDLLQTDNANQEEGMASLARDLVELHGILFDENRLNAFCLQYGFKPRDLLKREASLKKIIEDIVLSKDKQIKLCDIFAKIDDGLVNIADVFVKKELKHSDAKLLSEMKCHYTHLRMNYEKIMTASQPFDLVEFIRGLNDRVVQRLPIHLSKLIMQIQYAFDDRFKPGISQILGKANLTTPEDIEKLKSLRSGSFYKLICTVFENEQDRESIFTVTKSDLSVAIQPTTAPLASTIGVYGKEAESSNRQKFSFFPEKEDEDELQHAIEDINQRLTRPLTV